MYLDDRTVIGIKQEATQGTPVACTATDFILAEDVVIKPVAEILKRDAKRSSLDSIHHLKGQIYVEVTFKTEFKGGGAAGTAYTPFDAAVQACGFSSTVSAGVSVTYAPVSTAASANYFGPGKSVSLEIYKDIGFKHVVSGCIGDFKIVGGKAGDIVYIEFSFKGLFTVPTAAALPTQTYLALDPVRLAAATLTLNGYASHVISKFEIDCGNKITLRDDITQTYGVKGFVVTDREPIGSCDPEAPAIASEDMWTKFMNGTEGSTSIVIGTVAGNIHTLTLPKTQYKDLGYDKKSGILLLNAGLQFNQNTGDDWLSYVQT